MMKGIKTQRWMLLVSGILMVLLGIVTIFTPAGGLVSLALLISMGMVIAGVAEVVAYFGEDKAVRSGWMLALGILSALLGLWLLFSRGFAVLATIIPYVFAIWMVSSGIMRTVGAFSLKDARYPGWGWVLAMGILQVVAGFALMFTPVLTAAVTSIMITVTFISHGLGDIATFAALTKVKNLFKWAVNRRRDTLDEGAEWV